MYSVTKIKGTDLIPRIIIGQISAEKAGLDIEWKRITKSQIEPEIAQTHIA